MQQSIIDFLSGLSKSIIQGFTEAHDVIGNSIEEGIEKSRKKIFITGVAISITATGFFLIFCADAMFVMRGLGFVLIGLLAVLTGRLYTRNRAGATKIY